LRSDNDHNKEAILSYLLTYLNYAKSYSLANVLNEHTSQWHHETGSRPTINYWKWIWYAKSPL